ncbi:hypothetical protein GALMADRAFT_1086635 [Galerina marginata CBS 339.88]|uniref:Uncharacterized protein n=1 Tax=Galerina marginata (strain CBS 339.88) TaxID=685588 RepID=A0A067S9A1_GALM3|nr:hypothetical protein GALMADRAFT_1086635 [Galerina marginata CBS 339.88]
MFILACSYFESVYIVSCPPFAFRLLSPRVMPVFSLMVLFYSKFWCCFVLYCIPCRRRPAAIARKLEPGGEAAATGALHFVCTYEILRIIMTRQR